jgi:DNA/RNA endonuclease G (NUC1)
MHENNIRQDLFVVIRDEMKSSVNPILMKIILNVNHFSLIMKENKIFSFYTISHIQQSRIKYAKKIKVNYNEDN